MKRTLNSTTKAKAIAAQCGLSLTYQRSGRVWLLSSRHFNPEQAHTIYAPAVLLDTEIESFYERCTFIAAMTATPAQMNKVVERARYNAMMAMIERDGRNFTADEFEAWLKLDPNSDDRQVWEIENAIYLTLEELEEQHGTYADHKAKYRTVSLEKSPAADPVEKGLGVAIFESLAAPVESNAVVMERTVAAVRERRLAAEHVAGKESGELPPPPAEITVPPGLMRPTMIDMPAISVMHLKQSTREWLVNVNRYATSGPWGAFLNASHDNGFFLTVPACQARADEEQEREWAAFPGDLRAVFDSVADHATYGWFLLDVDGDRLAGLPVYTEDDQEPVEQEDEDGPYFLNHYHCYECDHTWTDVYPSQPDEDCPKCGARNCTPVDSPECDAEGNVIDSDPMAGEKCESCGTDLESGQIGKCDDCQDEAEGK